MCRETDVRLNTYSRKWQSALYSFGNFTVREYDDSTRWHSTTWRFGKMTNQWNDVSGKWRIVEITFRENDMAPNFTNKWRESYGLSYCFFFTNVSNDISSGWNQCRHHRKWKKFFGQVFSLGSQATSAINDRTTNRNNNWWFCTEKRQIKRPKKRLSFDHLVV